MWTLQRIQWRSENRSLGDQTFTMPYAVQNQVHGKGVNPQDSPQVKILSTHRANAYFIYRYTLTIGKHGRTDSHTVNTPTNTLSLWAIIMIWSWQSYKLVCKTSLRHSSWFQLIERLGWKAPDFIGGELTDENYLKEKKTEKNVRRKRLGALNAALFFHELSRERSLHWCPLW